MAFALPQYRPPRFGELPLADAPCVRFEPVAQDGVAPEGYHATTVYPEYFHLDTGRWELLAASRMDCVVVLGDDGRVEAREFRRLVAGDRVAIGRTEDGQEGILVHTEGFPVQDTTREKFAFRSRVTRETAFSIDYDHLYELLLHERGNGFILWVAGPAVAFDRDARDAFVSLIRQGFVHGLLAGNALATHDIEGALYGTALGQELYTKRPVPLGHYRHLDTLNRLRNAGSIEASVRAGLVENGIIHALVQRDIPYVLAGSIRDDGPLPGVVGDAYAAQDHMRRLASRATTVIALATQLHTIATGNMTPSYSVLPSGEARPVFFYVVDMSEFAVDKLANRGSLTARTVLTNVQDFVVTLERGLARHDPS